MAGLVALEQGQGLVRHGDRIPAGTKVDVMRGGTITGCPAQRHSVPEVHDGIAGRGGVACDQWIAAGEQLNLLVRQGLVVDADLVDHAPEEGDAPSR